jgi:hypothetical protein
MMSALAVLATRRASGGLGFLTVAPSIAEYSASMALGLVVDIDFKLAVTAAWTWSEICWIKAGERVAIGGSFPFWLVTIGYWVAAC